MIICDQTVGIKKKKPNSTCITFQLSRTPISNLSHTSVCASQKSLASQTCPREWCWSSSIGSYLLLPQTLYRKPEAKALVEMSSSSSSPSVVLEFERLNSEIIMGYESRGRVEECFPFLYHYMCFIYTTEPLESENERRNVP